jgi:hypothetical protein
VDLRAHVTGKATGWLGMAETGVTSPLLARADEAASGLFVVKAAGFWPSILPYITSGLPAGRLPGGATPAQLLGSMDGDMVGWSMAGEDDRFTVLVGLSRDKPVRRLLGACGPVGDALPGVLIEKKEGRCLVTVDPSLLLPGGPVTRSLSAEVWVDDGALRIDVAGGGWSMWAIRGLRDQAEPPTADGPESRGARVRAGRLGRRRGELIRDLVRGLERSAPDCRAMAGFVRRFQASRGEEIARIDQQLGATPTTYAELVTEEQHMVLEPLGARHGAVLDPCAENPEFSTALRSLGLP